MGLIDSFNDGLCKSRMFKRDAYAGSLLRATIMPQQVGFTQFTHAYQSSILSQTLHTVGFSLSHKEYVQ